MTAEVHDFAAAHRRKHNGDLLLAVVTVTIGTSDDGNDICNEIKVVVADTANVQLVAKQLRIAANEIEAEGPFPLVTTKTNSRPWWRIVVVAMTILGFVLMARRVWAQPAPLLTDRECFERSVEGCLCQGEQHLRDVHAKAMAYDELLKHPPSCAEASVAAWGTAALLLLEALRAIWGALSERLVRDAEWEANFCHPPPAGFYEPQYCWNGRTPIGLRLEPKRIGNALPGGRRDPRW